MYFNAVLLDLCVLCGVALLMRSSIVALPGTKAVWSRYAAEVKVQGKSGTELVGYYLLKDDRVLARILSTKDGSGSIYYLLNVLGETRIRGESRKP